MEQVRFIRREYDSLINRVWDPVTNDYTLYELTNYAALPRHMQRAIPKPDFLFSAVDLGGTSGFTYSNTVANATESLAIGITGLGKFDAFKTINYDQTVRPGHLAGPGTITTPLVLPTLMVYNKLGPEYFNTTLGFPTNAFISEVDQSPLLALSWASFDGSTNAPEVYPNGTSLAELESLLTGPSPVTVQLPPANVGANYSAEFAAQGGQPPYTWSLAPGSPGLPDGLSLTPDGQITGAPTGPAAIYDFTVRVTDSSGAFKDLPYTITVF